MKRTAKQELQVHLDGAFRGVPLSILAAGAYGIACELPAGQTQYLQALYSSLDTRVGTDLQRAASQPVPIIIKFVRLHSGEELEAAVREAKMQSFVSGARVAASGRLPEIIGSALVPELFFSGVMGPSSHEVWYVSVMARARGIALGELMKRTGGRITSGVYAGVEKAIYSLWLVGAAHADFHENNVIVDPVTDAVMIIDLGFAVLLPPGIVSSLRKEGSVADEAGDVYKAKVSRYVSSVLYKRGGKYQYEWFNPDGRMIDWLYNKVSDKANIQKARVHAWSGLSREQLVERLARKVVIDGGGMVAMDMDVEMSDSPGISAVYSPMDLEMGPLRDKSRQLGLRGTGNSGASSIRSFVPMNIDG